LDKSGKSKLVNDIESRLDDFFGEQDEIPPPQSALLSLEKLKSSILSIDWEITDACLSDMINETEALIPQFENDTYSLALLRMLRALGRYIRKRKVQAHQDAIKQIMSVFASLETVVQEQRLNEQQKKRIVAKEVLSFKKLKAQLDTQRGLNQVAAPASGNPQGLDKGAVLPDNLSFAQAMLAVEERFNSQVAQLKAELASLQQDIIKLRRQ
jgi:hypothetical protein